MKKALQAFAIVAPVFVASAVPATSHEVNDPYQAINEAYSDLKATANTLEFWQFVAAVRPIAKKTELQGPFARFTLIMDTIDKGKYDNNLSAQRQLSICATQDIAKISQIINMRDYGLQLLQRNATHHFYHLERSTGDHISKKNCNQILDFFVR